MAFHKAHCLRAFIFVLALALGLAGQGFAQVAMAMPPDNSALAGMAMMSADSMKSADMCPGCAGMHHSTTLPSGCSVGLCSGAMAIPAAPISRIAVVVHTSFLMPVFQKEHGITIPPDPGPPRLLHLS